VSESAGGTQDEIRELAENLQDILLSVRDLTVDFHTRQGIFRAIHGVSFDVRHGQVIGLVGESGSGKSVTALSLLRLLPEHSARIASGRIMLDGVDILQHGERAMRSIRGQAIAMIFQDPMTSLNPIFTVGRQVCEPLMLNLGMSRDAAGQRAVELLALVGIPAPERCLKRYPHELSGGMRQRVMIAIALSCNPRILIADEPTTALDVTTQAQILDLLRDLQRKLRMSVLLITHDLGVVAEFADQVQVMYAGRIVERASVSDIFARPRHPYTEGLLRSMPPFDGDDPERLPTIEGTVASPFAMPSGCAFHPRCPHRMADCTRIVPQLDPVGPGHEAGCLLNREHAAQAG
jgi:oligopeptide/dipeptide ABC transporter ATP-binding protein